MGDNPHLYGLILEDLVSPFWVPGDPLYELSDYQATVSIDRCLEGFNGYHVKRFIPLPEYKEEPIGDYIQGWNDCINWILKQDRIRKDLDGYYDPITKDL